MFGRTHRRRRQRVETTGQTECHVAEIARLKSQISRLENALTQVIAASDDVVTDFELRSAAQKRPASAGFAAEWTRLDSQESHADDSFFAVAETDRRAREWLLAKR